MKKKRIKSFFPEISELSQLEKDAKEVQDRCKTEENSDSEEIKMLKDKIRRVSEFLLDAAEKYARNEEYRKKYNARRKAHRDEEGDYIKDDTGIIYDDIFITVELPYIKIEELKIVTETVAKVTKILVMAGILPKAA
jgi:hypothetical protein